MSTDNDERIDQHYIDREEFTAEMTEYRHECDAAKKNGLPKPDVPESVGLKFLLMAEGMSTWHKFRGYTYKGEMVGDAVENMIRYAHNFDPTVPSQSGAFSYFNRLCYFAFLRRIAKEDKQYRTKVKWVQSFAVLDMLPEHRQDHDQGTDFQNQFYDYLMDYYDAEHKKIEKKKAPVKAPPPQPSLDKAVAREKGMMG